MSFNEPVRQITGDRQDYANFESRMQKESFDAVIDMICFNEADAKSTVAAFGGRVNQIVVCSSSAVYQRPFRSVPLVESEETLTDDPHFPTRMTKHRWNGTSIRFSNPNTYPLPLFAHP